MAAETKARGPTPVSPVCPHVCACMGVCAYAHQGLRKIIAIDLRRRNVEMLPDGTFSCEWLQMRRVILAKARAEGDAADAHQNNKCCPDRPSAHIHISAIKV